jgi:rod shape-determining protein MreC
MVAIPSRHRSLVLLASMLTLQVLLLAVQIKRGGQARLIRVWSVSLVSPVQSGGRWVLDEIHGVWSHYIALHGAGKENDALRAEVAQLQLRNAELEGRAAEADRLARLLAFREAHVDIPMVAARVISAGADPASRTVFIDRGQSDGIRRNMAVITTDGAVGKILEAFKSTAQVQLLSDKDAGVGVLLASSRSQGVVTGTGEPSLVMKYVSNDLQVPYNERVLTSGQDRIFPKDLPVGTVIEVRPGMPFKSIRVKPAAHLDQLEEVLVLLTQSDLEPQKEKPPAPQAAPNSGKPSAAGKGPGQP